MVSSEHVGQQFKIHKGLGVECDHCGDWHPAEYSHDSYYGKKEPVYEVVCDKDHLSDYYLNERLTEKPKPAKAPRRRR